jgi:peptidyl-prolyl cis-trans isomerase D
MLSTLRRMADTWPARILFIVLAAAFVGWGVSGKMSGSGADPTSVATVDGQSIANSSFEAAYRQDMQRIAQRFPDPTQIPPAIRRAVGQQTVEKLVTQKALDQSARAMGVVAPDGAVEAAITAMPAFQGVDGKFDHNTYLGLLAQNNLTPIQFQSDMRMDIAKNQVLTAVQAGAHPSDMLTDMVFGYLNETRQADLVSLSFASHAKPPAPPDATLQRFYANHLARYTAPEFRHVRLVILSPETIGRSLPVTDTEMAAWFKTHRAEFQAPEKRTLQVITAGTAAQANALAAQWRAGAAWPAMEAAAKTAGASTAELDDTTRDGIPAPELAAAAFAAPLNTITGPVTEPLGLQIVRVTGITPAKNPGLADLHDTIRARIGAEKAGDLIDARAQKLQDLFAGGSHIDEVPTDIGAIGAEGTLDAQGNTPDGTPAPIPAAPPKLRAAIIADAFKAAKNETGQLTEGPDRAWYAVVVDNILKPDAKPFAMVHDRVLADWQAEQVHHATEDQAAKLLATIKGGQTILNAAWGSGQQVIRSPALRRNHPVPGVPAELNQLVFTLKQGDATMVETNVGFMVAQLASVTKPDPKADRSDMGEVRQGLRKALADDYLASYATAVRDETRAQLNTKVLDQLTSQPGE